MKHTDQVNICSNVANLTLEPLPARSAGEVEAELRCGAGCSRCSCVSAGTGSALCLQLLVALHAPVRENSTVPGGVVE